MFVPNEKISKKQVEKQGVLGNNFKKNKKIIFGLLFCDLSDERQLITTYDILHLISTLEAQFFGNSAIF